MLKRWIALSAVFAVLAGALAWVAVVQPWTSASASALVGPHDPVVSQSELQRRVPGSQVREVTLTAGESEVDLGGKRVRTWTFNGQVPGPQLDARAGDVVRTEVVNTLPDPLTVHWHGIALRNDMDGVPGVTQPAIAPGGRFTYEFIVPAAGTYMYHSHVGTQLDRGLYGPLVVQPTAENPAGQREITMMLDDWIDGTGKSPDDVLADLKSDGAQMSGDSGSGMSGMDHGSGMSGMDHGSGMSGMDHGSGSGMSGMDHGSMNMGSRAAGTAASPLGSDTTDVTYPMYLINGRRPESPAAYEVTPGERVRLRLVNVASSTPFRLAYGGGPMTVVATDGYDVRPVAANSLMIGMGERYDVIVRAPRAGAAPLVAAVERKSGQAMSVLRTAGASLPSATVRPGGLNAKPLALTDLHATPAVTLAQRRPDRTYRAALTGGMMSFDWGISAPSEDGVALPVKQGERIRLELTNNTMMWHPVHLHGHTFQVLTGNGTGPRKDTVAIPPMGTVTIEFDADNPGQWMLHCHNIYHAEAGMMTSLSYVN